MSKDLTVIEGLDDLLPAVDMKAMSGMSSDYLGGLQLCAASDQQVKAGKFPMNHYCIKKGKNYKDLGETVSVLPLHVIAKAIDTKEEGRPQSFDPTSDLFKRIKADAGVKDSGCMWGTEYLVYVPDAEEFAVLFLRNPTLRNENDSVLATLKKGATLDKQLIPNKVHGDYMSLKCDAYVGQNSDLMTFEKEALAEAMEKFLAQTNRKPAPEALESVEETVKKKRG